MDGDSGLAFDIVNDLLSNGVGLDVVLFDLVAPLQSEIGTRWQQGDFSISEEHASTAAIETVVALLAGSMAQSDDGARVVVACAEGDLHSFPARLASVYLIYAGYRVTFLGASIPATDLADYLTELKPAALVLSCSIATSLPGARDSILAAHESGTPVVAGGRGFGSDATIARKLGADEWLSHPLALDELLRRWHPNPDAAEAAAVDRNDETRALERAASMIQSDACDNAEEMLGQTVRRRRLAADIEVLSQALVAAVLLEDAATFIEFSQWHSQLWAETHAGHDTAPIVLSALHDAVAEHSPTGADFVDRAIAALD